MIHDRVATMSCKAAVKGNNHLSFAEADHLIDELLNLDNPYACPHGRPTIISMSKYELEKKILKKGIIYAIMLLITLIISSFF